MNHIKSLSQPSLSLLLALYIGFVLNLSVLHTRFDTLFTGPFSPIEWVGALAESAAVVLLTYFLLTLLSLSGRMGYRLLSALLLLVSVAASYYMTFFNVVIGYGVVISVLTTDTDLSKEVVGRYFILWLVLPSAFPLWLIWRSPLQRTLWAQLNTPSQRWRALRHLAWVLVAIGLPLHFLDRQQEAQAVTENVDLPSYGGVLAHSYLPSNWLSALGLYGWTQYEEYTDQRQLFDPAEHFAYAGTAPEDTYVVFVIGETARWDHMGLLGYERNTTPKLAAEKNLVALRGVACDTATKLSLRCMFVREGGTANNPQRSLKEQNVFAVLHSLGFSSELFAMQSEVWFYNNTEADNYAFREMIAAEKRNEGKTVDDMLLVSELQASLANHPRGKHLVILHTKGSHYSYIQRYPRAFAQYQPECNGVDDGCSKAQLVNAFDNSILYTDTVLAAVIDQLRDKKAIMMYAADHGESIDEDSHLHGTPRHMAPDEQFRVPVLLWASDTFLAQAPQQRAWQRLKTMQQSNTTVRHEAIFDSLLGCLGYESPNGGIVAKNNWCHPPKAPA